MESLESQQRRAQAARVAMADEQLADAWYVTLCEMVFGYHGALTAAVKDRARRRNLARLESHQ